MPSAGIGHESFAAEVEMVGGVEAEESSNTLEGFLKKTFQSDATQDVMRVVSR